PSRCRHIFSEIFGNVKNLSYLCSDKSSWIMVEMVIRLEDESLLAPLKRVMKSLLGITDVVVRRDSTDCAVSKERESIYQQQLSRLDKLAALKADWDDEGALPIEPKTIRNVKRLIELSDDDELKKWTIFPDINGTILLESNSGDATVSIGNKDFSFTSSRLKGSHKRLTTSSLLSVMRKISA
ncbi:MAG: hypothetical protein IJS95_03615, partial [Prevotella sp.]|nr:hypothetical protein [Prevotella sp.]